MNSYIKRKVRLKDGWYKDSITPFILTKKEGGGEVRAFFGPFGGYYYIDTVMGKKCCITAKNSGQFEEEAISLYSPFPKKKLGLKELTGFWLEKLRPIDYILLILSAVIAALLAILIPYFTRLLTGDVLESKSLAMLLGVGIFMLTTELSTQMIKVIKNLISSGIQNRIRLFTEAAAMDRLLSLPISFYRRFPSGELYQRYRSVSSLCDILTAGSVTVIVSIITGLAYLGQIGNIAPSLAPAALVIILTTVMISAASTLMRSRIGVKAGSADAAENALTLDIIRGAKKIKQAGAEDASIKNWQKAYGSVSDLRYDPPFFVKLSPALLTAIKLFGAIVIYFLAAKNGLVTSDYLAFNAAYGGLLGAFSSLFDMALSMTGIRAVYELARPVLDEVPEDFSQKEIPESLSGEITVSDISFGYDSDRQILKGVSFHASPGEYIAITGKTGCGKTTLVRLLLGLEKPDGGSVCYDGKDISGLNLKKMRKNIGAVIQDGKLFPDDIYTNVSIGHEDVTEDEVLEAMRIAKLTEELKEWPLGLYTTMSEGDSGFSGGQRQRLLIARAIVKKPGILIFDEATSALDSKLQADISAEIDAMKATRIVVAHRLSTIRHANRILYIEDGRIAEEGTFDELMALDGGFAALAKRQV